MIEEQYLGLLSGVMHGGVDGDSRAGKTRSVFGRMLKHDMSKGFPLLTTKKIYWKNAVTELLWILQGRTDMAYLHEHGLKYWDEPATAKELAEKYRTSEKYIGLVINRLKNKLKKDEQFEKIIENFYQNQIV